LLLGRYEYNLSLKNKNWYKILLSVKIIDVEIAGQKEAKQTKIALIYARQGH
jgi:hypothetical protein